MYLICHMTSRDHFIEKSCKFMGESLLWFVTTLTILVTINIMIVEICF